MSQPPITIPTAKALKAVTEQSREPAYEEKLRHLQKLSEAAAREGKYEIRFDTDEYSARELERLRDAFKSKGYFVKLGVEEDDGPGRPGYKYLLLNWETA